MATLNTKETEMLRNTQRALEYVLRNGYDPAKAEAGDEDQVYCQKLLKSCIDSVQTVVFMKGYYPK